MGELRCVDGSLLGVQAVPCRDRAGRSFDVTLALARDRKPFAVVGQRCGDQLADLAARVVAARDDPRQAARWPDPDDRFPVPDPDDRFPVPGPAGHEAFRPGEREYFTLRGREPGDPAGVGEVRCMLRSSADWLPGQPSAPGRWRLMQRAVIEAWGNDGTGVRAVLTSAELVSFLDTVLSEPCEYAVSRPQVPAARAGRPRRPSWR